MLAETPQLQVSDPAFAITSAEVHEAREESWFARTEYGIAVLRYDEVAELVKHPSLRQGSLHWPAHNGVTEGPFLDWWNSWILNKRRGAPTAANPAQPGFLQAADQGLVPRFQALAAELIDNFASHGQCEFVSSSPTRTPRASSSISKVRG